MRWCAGGPRRAQPGENAPIRASLRVHRDWPAGCKVTSASARPTRARNITGSAPEKEGTACVLQGGGLLVRGNEHVREDPSRDRRTHGGGGGERPPAARRVRARSAEDRKSTRL